jgi:hypothetical protein
MPSMIVTVMVGNACAFEGAFLLIRLIRPSALYDLLELNFSVFYIQELH